MDLTFTSYQVGVATGALGMCLLVAFGAIAVDVAARWHGARLRRRRDATDAQSVVAEAEQITRQAADL